MDRTVLLVNIVIILKELGKDQPTLKNSILIIQCKAKDRTTGISMHILYSS